MVLVIKLTPFAPKVGERRDSASFGGLDKVSYDVVIL